MALLDFSLRDNNPFSEGSIFIFPEGDVALDREPIVSDKSINDRYYTTVDGDEIGTIAFDAYGDSKYWWVIYDANDEIIIDPLNLETGITIRVPDLSKVKII